MAEVRACRVGAGPLYLPTNVALIGFFNYFYTFVQMDPTEVGDNLKKAGASIPNTRPGKATAAFIETVSAPGPRCCKGWRYVQQY